MRHDTLRERVQTPIGFFIILSSYHPLVLDNNDMSLIDSFFLFFASSFLLPMCLKTRYQIFDDDVQYVSDFKSCLSSCYHLGWKENMYCMNSLSQTKLFVRHSSPSQTKCPFYIQPPKTPTVTNKNYTQTHVQLYRYIKTD